MLKCDFNNIFHLTQHIHNVIISTCNPYPKNRWDIYVFIFIFSLLSQVYILDSQGSLGIIISQGPESHVCPQNSQRTQKPVLGCYRIGLSLSSSPSICDLQTRRTPKQFPSGSSREGHRGPQATAAGLRTHCGFLCWEKQRGWQIGQGPTASSFPTSLFYPFASQRGERPRELLYGSLPADSPNNRP